MNLINTSNPDLARKLIRESKEKPVIVQSQNPEFDRKMLEYGKFNILLSPENSPERDRLKQLSSDFNHIMAKLATKNNVAIGIDIKSLTSVKDKKLKAIRLARIIQNIKVCRKAKTKIKLLNFKNRKNAFDFLISLGASTQQAKEAID